MIPAIAAPTIIPIPLSVDDGNSYSSSKSSKGRKPSTVGVKVGGGCIV